MHGKFRGSGYSDVSASVREQMVPLQDLLRAMSIRREDIIADMGAGAGYYTLLFAKHASKVYALDGVEENTKLIEVRAKEMGLSNIYALTVDLCSQVPVKGITYAFFSNSLHDMPCWEELIGTIYNILPEGGRLAILEFKPDAPFGPPHSRISPEQLDEVVLKVGFLKRGTVDFRYHYFSLFFKAK
jgi:ubiquinone/menaquinone biosynthesis C-methylase UbiE